MFIVVHSIWRSENQVEPSLLDLESVVHMISIAIIDMIAC